MGEKRIVEGVASMAGRNTAGAERPGLARAIEAAMSQAVLDCYTNGVTDPDVIRKAQLDARRRVKAAWDTSGA